MPGNEQLQISPPPNYVCWVIPMHLISHRVGLKNIWQNCECSQYLISFESKIYTSMTVLLAVVGSVTFLVQI